MPILFSGDFHAGEAQELSSITKNALLKKYQQAKYDFIQYHIILGDGGFLWPGKDGTDRYNYKALACRPFPVLCVIGNHEPILGMNDLPEVDMGIGEKVYRIQDKPFVAYLKRGKVYTVDGFKILVLGGALSVDRELRKPGKTWWEWEYWSEQEKRDVFKLLERENTFDYVISHTGPHHINKRLFQDRDSYSEKFKDKAAFLNDEIHDRIQFREWWCGHWHSNLYYCDQRTGRGYQYLYKATKILDRVDGKLTVYNEYGDAKR